ncbi:hypothetical protein Leryth_015793 [Lithospermum erythrorhizon]|nr:hypothetical protein Leryth_015793 [Lithospermum erythrorhizon]
MVSSLLTGNPLSTKQWASVSMVFSGLSYQIYLRILEKDHLRSITTTPLRISIIEMFYLIKILKSKNIKTMFIISCLFVLNSIKVFEYCTILPPIIKTFQKNKVQEIQETSVQYHQLNKP